MLNVSWPAKRSHSRNHKMIYTFNNNYAVYLCAHNFNLITLQQYYFHITAVTVFWYYSTDLLQMFIYMDTVAVGGYKGILRLSSQKSSTLARSDWEVSESILWLSSDLDKTELGILETIKFCNVNITLSIQLVSRHIMNITLFSDKMRQK